MVKVIGNIHSKKTPILFLGAAHIDREYSLQNAFKIGSKHIAQKSLSLGGVVTNVAIQMRHISKEPFSLCSILGSDMDADRVLYSLKTHNIDSAYIFRSKDHPTAEYTCVLGNDGETIVGLSSTAIYESLSIQDIKPYIPQFQQFPCWVLDTNFPADILDYVLNQASDQNISVIVTSEEKVHRIKHCLSSISSLFLNERELRVLTHHPADLLKQGVKNVFVTRGSKGCSFFSHNEEHEFHPADVDILHTSGAGDAFAAGAIAAMVMETTLHPAQCGMNHAAHYISGFYQKPSEDHNYAS